MKILSVEFSNLNSLYGKWKIDFTTKEYEDHGIFTITGPTGSGKSTILDAIILALYGRTPRLDRVNTSSNEIMSRLASSCSSEVCFSHNSKTYRVTWLQHRAKGDSEGKLQNTKWELSEFETGKIIGERSKVPQTIVDLTGLNYERFIRTVILAQGGFAAFLHASEKERGPLLENISGTTIYSELSKLTFELTKAEKEKLTAIDNELKGITVMPEEAEKLEQSQLDNAQKRIAECDASIQQMQEAITWLSTIEVYQDELKKINKEEHELKSKIDQFAPKRPVLESARRALSITPIYETLKERRERSFKINKDLAESNKTLLITKGKARATEIALKSADEQLANLEKKYSDTSSVLVNVRSLDAKIAELESVRKEKDKAIAEEQNTLSKISEEQNNLRQKLSNNLAEQKKLQKRLEEQDCDEALIENLSSYAQNLQQIDVEQNRIDCAQHEQKNIQKIIESNKQAIAELNGQIAQIRKEEFAVKNDQLQKERELIKLLGSETEQTIRKELDQYSLKLQKFAVLQEKLERLLTMIQEVEDSKDRLDKIIIQQKLSAVKLAGARQTLADKNALVETTREIVTFQKAVDDLKDMRHLLVNGRPCPLCGAIHHPYATSLSLDTKANDKYQKAISEANIAMEEERRANEENTRLLTEIEVNKQHIGQLSQNVENLTKDISQEALEYELTGIRGRKPATWNTVIQQKVNIFTNRRNDLESKLDKVASTNTVLQNIRSNLDALHKRLTSINEELLVCTSDLKGNEALHQNNLNIESEAQKKRDEIMRSLERIFQRYGLISTTLSQLKQNYTVLDKRKVSWQNTKADLALITQQIETDTVSNETISKRYSELQEKISGLQTDTDSLKSEIKTLSKERFDLFGNQLPDKVDSDLKQALTEAMNNRNTASDANDEQQKVLAGIEHTIAVYTSQLETLAKEILVQEKDFQKALSENRFETEQAFISARISDNLREELQQENDSLIQREASITARKQDKSNKLSIELEKNLTTKPKDELEKELSTLNAELLTAQKNAGITQERLRQNQETKNRYKEKFKLYQEQEKITERWENLNKLIGSADGNNFRTFAQGLTFEVLIEYANRQLSAITSRYILVRNPNRPLDLQIVDEYQEGRIRSVDNLSGGESFLVSLALALGMSQMTSNNSRIDSLFLDEGFGTLDEQLLYTALDALSKLHHQGKLIGVISHVQELKENIPTRIEVIRQSSGKSALQGPGVSYLS